MKIDGMTSAANALRYWERRQEVTANNLANVSTNGFKAERVFASLMDGNSPVIGTSTDHRVGALHQTGQSSDVALGGGSYMVVQTPAGDRYTRGGSLQVTPDGFLSDADGNKVLGEKLVDGKPQPIKVEEGPMTIDRHGLVAFGGRPADTLRLEQAPPGVALAHEAGTRFIPDAARQIVPPSQRDVRQGTLEESNVDSLGGLVDLIGVQRAYAAVEKSISILDHVRETATSQLGKPV